MVSGCQHCEKSHKKQFFRLLCEDNLRHNSFNWYEKQHVR